MILFQMDQEKRKNDVSIYHQRAAKWLRLIQILLQRYFRIFLFKNPFFRDTNQYIAEKFIEAIYNILYIVISNIIIGFHLDATLININIELLVATYCPRNINFDFSKIALSILKIRLIFILAVGPIIDRVSSNFHVSHTKYDF